MIFYIPLTVVCSIGWEDIVDIMLVDGTIWLEVTGKREQKHSLLTIWVKYKLLVTN